MANKPGVAVPVIALQRRTPRRSAAPTKSPDLFVSACSITTVVSSSPAVPKTPKQDLTADEIVRLARTPAEHRLLMTYLWAATRRDCLTGTQVPHVSRSYFRRGWTPELVAGLCSDWSVVDKDQDLSLFFTRDKDRWAHEHVLSVLLSRRSWCADMDKTLLASAQGAALSVFKTFVLGSGIDRKHLQRNASFVFQLYLSLCEWMYDAYTSTRSGQSVRGV